MRKKSIFIIFLIVLNFLFVKSIFSNVQAASNKLGDVNNNGKIDSADYVLVRSHIIGTKKLTSDQITRADTNSDNKINSTDYVKIRQAIINKTDIVAPTPTPTTTQTPAPKYNLDAYFLNTYNRKGFKEIYSGNDAFIFKTSNGKYVLIDTGNKSTDIKNAIYNGLKDLQNKNTVTIDYMIISHMHSDHYGNANDIMKDTKFKIKNLIIKREKFSEIDESLVSTAKGRGINIIETDSKLKEGSYYTLSDNIKMYFFNVKDIYTSSDHCERRDYSTSMTSSISADRYAKSTDNKYIYFEGKDFLTNGNKVQIKTSTDLVESLGTDYRINGRFYVTMINDGQKRTPCSSNANSIAVLFQIKTEKGNKYMYIPSDLENNGYSPFGEYDSTYKTTIRGYAPTYFYDYKEENGKVKFIVKDNKLVKSTKTTPVKRASSYKTALAMKNKFSDIVGNITVYQSAHHGLNNYEEVINLLKINSSSVYTITPVGGNPKNNKTFQTSQGVYYLRNTNIMHGGGNDKLGTKCSITAKGTTTCAYY